MRSEKRGWGWIVLGFAIAGWIFLAQLDPVWTQSRTKRAPPNSSTQPLVPNEIIVPRRDLLFRLDRELKAGRVEPELDQALNSPQPEILWRTTKAAGKWRYGPIVPSARPIGQSVKVDVAVFGGEIESVTMAIALANTGRTVALVYDGVLGGLCSDTGANLRYWDGMPDVPRPPAQQELFEALGVKGAVAIPIGVEKEITKLINQKYKDKILLKPVISLDPVRIKKSGPIEHVDLDSGVQINAGMYLDTDPECRIGELAGLGYSVETPNLSYGLVFDLVSMKPEDWTGLRDLKRVTENAIEAMAGVSVDRKKSTGKLRESLLKLQECNSTDFVKVFSNSSFGYKSLAEGFNTYMQLKAVRTTSPELDWLNEHRVTSGFNMSRFPHSANLNSISYSFDETLLQNGHSLSKDPRWKELFAIEAQGMREYFRAISGNFDLDIRLPEQFYVRRSTAFFPTRSPYSETDFTEKPTSKWWMDYPMDLRDIRFRDKYEKLAYDKMVAAKPKIHRWNCRGATIETTIPNLYILNKCSVTPNFSGGLRILQNLINTGQDWVDHLPPLSVAPIAPSKAPSSRSIEPPSDQRSSTQARPL